MQLQGSRGWALSVRRRTDRVRECIEDGRMRWPAPNPRRGRLRRSGTRSCAEHVAVARRSTTSPRRGRPSSCNRLELALSLRSPHRTGCARCRSPKRSAQKGRLGRDSVLAAITFRSIPELGGRIPETRRQRALIRCRQPRDQRSCRGSSERLRLARDGDAPAARTRRGGLVGGRGRGCRPRGGRGQRCGFASTTSDALAEPASIGSELRNVIETELERLLDQSLQAAGSDGPAPRNRRRRLGWRLTARFGRWGCDPAQSLLRTLRDELRLTGAKPSCSLANVAPAPFCSTEPQCARAWCQPPDFRVPRCAR